MIRPHRWRRWGLALLVVAACAPPAQAQLFVAERPHPDFQVGPLFVGAIVTPRLGHAVIDVHFSLTFPPDKTIAGMEQDLYLLWPGPVTPDRTAGPPDRALARYVEARGFTVIEEGRTSLHALELYTMGTGTPPRRLPDGAPFVTFVRTGGALGLTSPATWIRIPWNYRMANRVWLMDLRFTDPSFVHPKASNWLERTLWGPRHRVSLSFNDVRARAMFPMYFEHRDRIVRLAEDPSQLLISFRESDHLKIDSMSPPAANRRLSETE
ncbi:MAG: hypothetical protein HY294_16670 [Candidatus Rokubacteria bacterium]|nr:hypothetical protein [Candidatus Rokubacteria bacterium]